MALTPENNWTISTEYNYKKCWFLVYNSNFNKYICINNPFLLNINTHTITGQFITSNWFKMAFSTLKDARFMLVFASSDFERSRIEEYINAGDFCKIYSHKEFVIDSNELNLIYRDIVQEHKTTENGIHRFTFYDGVETQYRTPSIDMFSLNIGLYYNNTDYFYKNEINNYEINQLLISLPTFTMNRNDF